MRFRNTWALLLMAALLGALVIWLDRDQPASGTSEANAVPTLQPVVLSFLSWDARAVRLYRLADARQVELVYGDDGLWYIHSPERAEADQGEVFQLLDALAEVRPQRMLISADEPVDKASFLADYDLEPPAIRVEIVLKDGVTHILRLGARNPANSGYYGMVDDDARVYLLPFYIGSTVERTLEQPPLKPTPSVEADAGALDGE